MPFGRAAAFVALALFASSTFAHMEIDSPPPLRHKSNPNYAGGGLVDFDMTSPLAPTGANFPCKGYLPDIYGGSPVSKPVATLTAGQPFNVTFGGSASHGGGSCQMSLSYDQGKTWGVIFEVVGGCPLTPGLNFNVPSGVPSGEAVLAWTWFNFIGNREMYMNCIHVNVDGASGGSFETSKMLEANIFGGPCQTVETNNVDFKNPNLTNCTNPITSADKVTLVASGGGGGSAPTSTKTATGNPTATATPTSTKQTEEPTGSSTTATATDEPQPTETDEPCPPEDGDDGDDDGSSETDTSVPSTPSSTAVPAPAPAPAPTGGSGSGACTDGAIQCSADGKSWSMCDHGAYVSMGSVAAGTSCVNGAMQFARRYPVARRSADGARWLAMRRLESAN